MKVEFGYARPDGTWDTIAIGITEHSDLIEAALAKLEQSKIATVGVWVHYRHEDCHIECPDCAHFEAEVCSAEHSDGDLINDLAIPIDDDGSFEEPVEFHGPDDGMEKIKARCTKCGRIAPYEWFLTN